MTNYEKMKNMKLKDVLDFLGFEKEVQQDVFLNIFQLINCRYCPAQKECSSGEICRKTQKNWLESETEPKFCTDKQNKLVHCENCHEECKSKELRE